MEITMECNPDDVTVAFARSLHSLPVNRISMGAQTFSDRRPRVLGLGRAATTLEDEGRERLDQVRARADHAQRILGRRDAAGADADPASGDAASTRASKFPRQLDVWGDGAGVPRHLSDCHGADVRLHPRRR